jgi:1-acyl-sn-glycerol-3-phosphate acyltransferase
MSWFFRQLRLLYEYLVLYGGLLFFALLCLLVSMTASVLHPLMPKLLAANVSRYVIMAGFRFYLFMVRVTGLVKCDLTALDALRDQPSLIIATNHPALIDVVLIASRLPRIVCVLKASLLNNPLLGGAARMAGYICNDSVANLIRQSSYALKEGAQLLIFPEGTRTVTQPVNAFKGGFGLIARKSRASVQTVFIETNSPFLGKGWSFFKKPEFPLVYKVRLGERFEVGGNVKTFVAELEAYYRSEMKTKCAPHE